MNKKNMLKIWFDKMFKMVIRVDNIDKINELLEQKQKTFQELQMSYYDSKGELAVLQTKIYKYEKVIEDIIKAKNRIVEQYEDLNNMKNKDREIIRELAMRHKNVKEEMGVLKASECSLQEITNNLEKMTKNCEKTIVELKSKVKQLEMQNDYSKKVDKFIDIFDKNSNIDEFNDIQEKIEKNFHSSECKLNDYNKKVNLESIIQGELETDSIIDEFLNL